MHTYEEYGGFLPLELNPGTEMFAKYNENLLRFNSVKAAISCAINLIKPKKILLPLYYCPSTIESIKKENIGVAFYNINEKLLPENVSDEEGTLILLVNYFGVCDEKIVSEVLKYNKSTVILDNAHSFFLEPIFRKNIFCVYSAKKIFGVPDGAYLVGTEVTAEQQIYSDAGGSAGYLIKAYEQGTNSAYADKKSTDRLIAGNYSTMSKLSKGLLENVDYSRVKQCRLDNYKELFSRFRNINLLELPSETAAYQFPLLLAEYGDRVKKELINKKIYVSTLWAGDDLLRAGNDFESSMRDHCVFLPIDQRYTKRDMEYISDIVFDIIHEIQG